MTLEERVNFYNLTFPNWPKLSYSNGWIVGSFCIGAAYAGSGYYGNYPHGYLKRMRALFPDFDKEQTLHMFGGSLCRGFSSDKDWGEDFPGSTFDINPILAPDYLGDAKEAYSIIGRKFDIILADCPYSAKDAERYGYPMINRKTIMGECAKLLNNDGYLIWLDEISPMYKKTDFKRIGGIGLERSTNHRVRYIFMYRKI